MPRSRRRHHSRSRSRSRSHSHERDREPKRRKIDNYESPHHKRSVSSEPEVIENENQNLTVDVSRPETINTQLEANNETEVENLETNEGKIGEKDFDEKCSGDVNIKEKNDLIKASSSENEINNDDGNVQTNEVDSRKNAVNIENETKTVKHDLTGLTEEESNSKTQSDTPCKPKGKPIRTPNKLMSPQQKQKKLDSEKKRIEKQKEKEDRERKKLEEKEERDRVKEEKVKQKQKEKEMKEDLKKREKEEKEQKKREKEEKDELKRKEKEQDKVKRQQEIDEKNREKQKIEERKQKAAAAFANFFVPKKSNPNEEKTSDENTFSAFMPFEVKSDMRLAPVSRKILTGDAKDRLDKCFEDQDLLTDLYLTELKRGIKVGKSAMTFPYVEDNNEDDVVIVEDADLGETIVDQKPKMLRKRVKFLKFHENQRPPYYGTWQKKSKHILPRHPFGVDKAVFNYDVDSDDEWEEEGEGESLKGTDDEEDKENESENEYEVDNEFFVPHCHLSDDEVDDEVNAKLSPESHKAKLKLLKNEFDEEMKSKTRKIKPRVIGCIWYDKTKSKVEEAIDRYLQPFAIICNGRIDITKRSDIVALQKKTPKQLDREHVPLLLKLIHGKVRKRNKLVQEFLELMTSSGTPVHVSKLSLGKQFRRYAQWMKCPDEGPMYNKLCWYVSEETRKEFNVDLPLPNKGVTFQ